MPLVDDVCEFVVEKIFLISTLSKKYVTPW